MTRLQQLTMEAAVYRSACYLTVLNDLVKCSPQEQRKIDLEAAMRELDAEFPGAVLPTWDEGPF